MAKTFNKAPISVSLPSTTDIKEYVETYYNWSGLSNIKNTFAVDQNSFSELNNVYVDAYNLLRSRPSLKYLDLGLTVDVTDVYTLQDHIIYECVSSGDLDRKAFRIDDVTAPSDSSLSVLPLDTYPIVKNDVVFIFKSSEPYVYSHNINDTNSRYGLDLIYVPIKTPDTEESDNILLDGHKFVYIYDGITFDSVYLGNDYKIYDDVTNTLLSDKLELGYKLPLTNVKQLNNEIHRFKNNGVMSMVFSKNGMTVVIRNDELWYSYNNSVFKFIKLYEPFIVDTTVYGGAFTNRPFINGKLSTNGQYWCVYYHDKICFLNILSNVSTIVKLTTNVDTAYAGRYKGAVHGNLMPLLIGQTKIYSDRERLLVGDFESPEHFILFYASNDNTLIQVAYKYVTDNEIKYFALPSGESSDDINTTVYLFDGMACSLNTTTDRSYVATIANKIRKHNGDGVIEGIQLNDCETIQHVTAADGTLKDIACANINVSKLYYDSSWKRETLKNFENVMAYSFPDGILTQDSIILPRFDNTLSTDNNVLSILYEQHSLHYDLTKFLGSNNVSDYTPYLEAAGQHVFLARIQFYRAIQSEYNNDSIVICKSPLIASIVNGLTDTFFNLDGASYSKKLILNSTDSSNEDVLNYSIDKSTYTFTDGVSVYSNNFKKPLRLEESQTDITYNKLIPSSSLIKNDVIYLSDVNRLLINKPTYNDDGELMLYFPKSNENVFDKVITGLYNLSDTDVLVFFEDDVWRVTSTENGYQYYETRLNVGCKLGSDILTAFDGASILVPTRRGLAHLSYQQFVQSTEQTIMYLSDSILDTYLQYYEQPILMYKFDFYVILYNKDSESCLLLDVRNNSWWKFSFELGIVKIYADEGVTKLLLSDGSLYELDFTDDKYYDVYKTGIERISWRLVSQKLVLSANDNVKHIKSISLNNNVDADYPSAIKLQCTKYYKQLHNYKTESLMYDVQSVRTYVKKLNYNNVHYFQYALHNDELAPEMSTPLSLNSITIKYKIGGQIK